MINWKVRIKAGAIHFGLSLAIAAVAAALVFLLWYPYPYSEISGGRELFMLVVSVDVILGPLITFAVFNLQKPRKELVRDLAVVGIIQLAGLAYGLWTVSVARPVHLVFEYNRFRVVHAIEVPPDMLDKTPAGVTALPLHGPTLLSLRPFKDNKEKTDATLADMGGVPLASRPDLWQTYEAGKAQVLESLKPIADLKARFPARAAAIDAVVASTGRGADALGYTQMVGRKTFWTAFVDRRSAEVQGFLPLDSF